MWLGLKLSGESEPTKITINRRRSAGCRRKQHRPISQTRKLLKICIHWMRISPGWRPIITGTWNPSATQILPMTVRPNDNQLEKRRRNLEPDSARCCIPVAFAWPTFPDGRGFEHACVTLLTMITLTWSSWRLSWWTLLCWRSITIIFAPGSNSSWTSWTWYVGYVAPSPLPPLTPSLALTFHFQLQKVHSPSLLKINLNVK